MDNTYFGSALAEACSEPAAYGTQGRIHPCCPGKERHPQQAKGKALAAMNLSTGWTNH